MVDSLPSKQIVWVQIPLFAHGGITQLVECMLCKHKVTGSSPVTSIKDGIIQLVECWNHNPNVVGSSPTSVKTEYGAIGSAPVLGTGGHEFKSRYSEYNYIWKIYISYFALF